MFMTTFVNNSLRIQGKIMNAQDFTRRRFLINVSAGSVAIFVSSPVPIIGNITKENNNISISLYFESMF